MARIASLILCLVNCFFSNPKLFVKFPEAP
jgi:hypothetical protein